MSIHWPNYLKNLDDYVFSINVVGYSAKDEKVLEYAKKQKKRLVTGDKRLALYSILDNHPVIFLGMNGKAYSINPCLENKENFKMIDDLTKYILDSGNVIIP